MHSIWSCKLCVAAGFAVFLAAAVTTRGEEPGKSGVSPNVISRPTGPGSLEGLGDAFQPALNTGMARYAVAIQLPPGVAGFSPSLSLEYDMGYGQGPVGIGWALDVGCVRRQTDKGLPRYVEDDGNTPNPDRYIGMEEEELVRLNNGYFLAKIEGTFLRYQRVGDHWTARTKSGILLEFGLTPAARLTDLTGQKVFKWCLERQTDLHGNVIQYTYQVPDAGERQNYLTEIRYGPGSPGSWTHSYVVTLDYEPNRPDTFTDYRSGFRVRTSQRLRQIDVRFNSQLIRRYALGYTAHPHWSLLSSVTQYGADGTSTLPATTFAYHVAEICNPSVVHSANDALVTSSAGPLEVMDNPTTDLIDLNADGLPDLLDTGLSHTAFINRGITTGLGTGQLLWEGPVDVTAVDPRVHTFDLSQPDIHLGDMTGDGVADFVVTNPTSGEFFENTASVSWGESQPISKQAVMPPSPFDPANPNVKTADLDFDKRIDIIRSESTGYTIWFNRGSGVYSEPTNVDGAYYFGDLIEFDDPGFDFADLNGDRLADVVQIRGDSVIYCASMGQGLFDSHVEIPLPDRTIDVTPGGNLSRASMEDINADGLADLVVERAVNDDLWLWLNLGDNEFSSPCTITDCPASSSAAVRWADINGNGTTDLVYADSTLPSSKINAVDIGLLINGSPHTNLLKRIENGYGRRTDIVYKPSTVFLTAAFVAGHAWTIAMPFPTSVVAHVETSIGLDLDGYPDEGSNGDVYKTDFAYRDGYYDPIEKQFRGFDFVKQIERGDERFGGDKAPTLVTRFKFHTGAPDGFDNDGDGTTDEAAVFPGREEEPLKGVELWRELTGLPDDPLLDGNFAPDSQAFERHLTPLNPVDGGWTIRNLCTATGGQLATVLGVVTGNPAGYQTDDFYGRDVRQSVRQHVTTTLIEQSISPRTLRTDTDTDVFGNDTLSFKRGDLANSDDDLWESTDYALDANAEASWVLDRVSRVRRKSGGPSGTFVSETRHYYDGPAFVGLPLGLLGPRGVLHRTEALVSDGSAPAITERSFILGDPRNPSGVVDVLRHEFDVFGNPTTLRDANGNDRLIGYDLQMHTYPVSETILIGGASPPLHVTAAYDYRWGKPTFLVDFNEYETVFTYDQFGRLSEESLPNDPANAPTRTYQYDLGAPFSRITTVAHPNEGGLPGSPAPDVVTTQYFDGLGRKLGLREVGANVMRDVTLYGSRGKSWKLFQPYTGNADGGTAWSLPPLATAAYLTKYDAKGRIVEVITPPDENGLIATQSKTYQPLRVIEFDGEDNNASGPHANTPKTLVYDGLERLIEVHEIETLSGVDSGTFITHYRYAMPDLLAEIQDANNNIKYMRYDGLGRKIFMNDLNRGHMHYTYDAAGNLTLTEDAKQQQIAYTYDGANRILTEDFRDTGHPLSLNRTPDVAYHYDEPSDDYSSMPNTRGRLAWVADLTGAEFFGYNGRGAQETTIKRIDQISGPPEDFMTTTLVDNLDRVYQIVYPDGGVVRQTFDNRGLLASIPNFAPQLTYTPSGQPETVDFANGVTTVREYDPRLRLKLLFTQNAASEVFQNLTYDYDQADNITAIADGRAPFPPGEEARDQAASYLMDNLYRLRQAVGAGYGTLNYDYDRLGNMALAASPDIADPDVNIGTMTSGQYPSGGAGQSGTSDRLGREAGDAPGPHALTTTSNGVQQRAFEYDDNGNMTDNNGDRYVFDFRDRLGDVDVAGQPAPDIRYLYDYSGRRVIKRVDGDQTSYINRYGEIRDGEMIKYVWNGDRRLAQVTGGLPDAPIVTQRISLVSGWNAISFQVDPGVNDPASLLSDIDGKFIAVYGWNGTDYTTYQPGALGNTLVELTPNRGYWIFMNSAEAIMFHGPIQINNVPLLADAPNFVALPGVGTSNLEDLLTTYPEIDCIWFTGNGGEVWNVSSNLQSTTMTSANMILPGCPAWFWVHSDMSLTYLLNQPLDSSVIHSDHLGSTNIRSDQSAQKLEEMYTYPFGGERFTEVTEKGNVCNYRFVGKEQDFESTLYYVEARYYFPIVGKFISVDPLLSELTLVARDRDDRSRILQTPDLNLYCYSTNSPLVYSDTSGLLKLGIIGNVSFEFGTLGFSKQARVLYNSASDSFEAEIGSSSGPLTLDIGSDGVSGKINKDLKLDLKTGAIDLQIVGSGEIGTSGGGVSLEVSGTVGIYRVKGKLTIDKEVNEAFIKHIKSGHGELESLLKGAKFELAGGIGKSIKGGDVIESNSEALFFVEFTGEELQSASDEITRIQRSFAEKLMAPPR